MCRMHVSPLKFPIFSESEGERHKTPRPKHVRQKQQKKTHYMCAFAWFFVCFFFNRNEKQFLYWRKKSCGLSRRDVLYTFESRVKGKERGKKATIRSVKLTFWTEWFPGLLAVFCFHALLISGRLSINRRSSATLILTMKWVNLAIIL